MANPAGQTELTKNVEKEGCLDVTGGAQTIDDRHPPRPADSNKIGRISIESERKVGCCQIDLTFLMTPFKLLYQSIKQISFQSTNSSACNRVTTKSEQYSIVFCSS
jgi:hypothetical protein